MTVTLATATGGSTTSPAPAVRIRGLRKVYDGKAVLDGIDLDVAPGQLVALLGPSGTGKTTLLRLLAGFERPDAGELGVPLARTTVYQEPRLVPAHRVLRNVMLGQRGTAANRTAALASLAEVGLADKARSWPATLSGGEAQRVALARALVREPRLLLLDEPFAALDALTRLKMHDLVERLRRRHDPAIVMVTHDVDEALRLADRVVMLRDGHVSVDLLVDLPHPRAITDPHLLAHRRRLLAELGVDTPEATP
ncbi:ABC transporter ATP-binding protein [Pimelobacter simplex]|uniref:ABC transporter ATP-binding protein n=1 Tax=Nocardioides simplex TaxID=2045 RepID=UPI00366EB65C